MEGVLLAPSVGGGRGWGAFRNHCAEQGFPAAAHTICRTLTAFRFYEAVIGWADSSYEAERLTPPEILSVRQNL